jgi:hypothetical protein
VCFSLSIETTVGWGSIGRLSAATVWGAIRGLESFSQLTSSPGQAAAEKTIGGGGSGGGAGSVLINSSYVFIEDAPRFPWRGMMIDTRCDRFNMSCDRLKTKTIIWKTPRVCFRTEKKRSTLPRQARDG